MNPIVIVIAVLVVLAVVVLVAAARRRDTDEAAGLLSRETVKRDRGEPAVLEGASTARPAARSSAPSRVERRSDGELVTAGAPDRPPTCRPTPRPSASPAGSSSTAASSC